MKLKASRYNVDTQLDDQNVIYNMISNKYVLYDPLEKDYVDKLLNNLNKEAYEIREAEMIKKFVINGIVIDDEVDEIDKVSHTVNKMKYQDRIFFLTILPTWDCNFRCPYCFEERNELRMDDETIENIIEYVKKIAKKVKELRIVWFGGEPMLEYESIKRMTNEFKKACKEEGCNYCGQMVTNGYLLSDENIDELEDLGITSMQITVDGDKEFHNKRRPLENGEGTFEKVLDSIIKVATKNIMVMLRMNVDEENIDSISKLLDRIPKDIRKNIRVSIVNTFQNEKKINPFYQLKAAIDKGYIYKTAFSNNTFGCLQSYTSSLNIHPDGRITVCEFAAQKGLYFGKIEKHGRLNITNNSELLKFRYSSPLKNDNCRECNLLPQCLGACPLKLYENKNKCMAKKQLNEMEIDDAINLDIYYDLKHNLVQDVNIL